MYPARPCPNQRGFRKKSKTAFCRHEKAPFQDVLKTLDRRLLVLGHLDESALFRRVKRPLRTGGSRQAARPRVSWNNSSALPLAYTMFDDRGPRRLERAARRTPLLVVLPGGRGETEQLATPPS